MEAKLAKLAVYEAAEAKREADDQKLREENEKLLSETDRLKKALIERGLQPDQHGLRAVEQEVEVEVEKVVVSFIDKEVPDKDNPGQTKIIRRKVETTETVKEMQTVQMLEIQIDLPPSGGDRITRNGMPYYHGQTYLFTPDVATDVREQMYRSWDHERNIKGSDENAYRPHMSPVLNGRRSFARR
jgi:hypothetical protein